MPGGKTRKVLPPHGNYSEGFSRGGEVVFRMRRPTIIDWGTPREDGCVEIVGRLVTWPRWDGKIESHLIICCFFESYDVNQWPYIKRYAPEDFVSYRADLANLPSIVQTETLEARGFRLDG